MTAIPCGPAPPAPLPPTTNSCECFHFPENCSVSGKCYSGSWHWVSVWNQTNWEGILVEPLTSLVIVGKSFYLSEPSFLHLLHDEIITLSF